MELFDLSWANRAATGLICTTCGYVHEFVGSELQLYDAGRRRGSDGDDVPTPLGCQPMARENGPAS